MANTAGEKELKTKWPVVKGTTLGTTKIKGRKINLVAEGFKGTKCTVPEKDKTGLNE